MKDRHFVPAYVFGLLILVGASIPSSGFEEFRGVSRVFDLLLSEYSLHFFGFGIFAALMSLGYCRSWPSRKPLLHHLRAGWMALLFGFFVELYQIPIPHRYFELHDLGVDAAGIVLALGLFHWIFLRNRFAGLVPPPS